MLGDGWRVGRLEVEESRLSGLVQGFWSSGWVWMKSALRDEYCLYIVKIGRGMVVASWCFRVMVVGMWCFM